MFTSSCTLKCLRQNKEFDFDFDFVVMGLTFGNSADVFENHPLHIFLRHENPTH
jgi:hypothetical protein